MQTRATVSVRYPVQTTPEAWVLPEGTVPEAPAHHDAAHRLTLLLEAWAAKQREPVRVLRNLAIRWLEQFPRTGIDPDVCVLASPPPDLDFAGSVCLWKPGHTPPPICFEVVSANHPYKDYTALQERYAALGAHELCVFDPLLSGPPSLGGPVPLQLWRRDVSGSFERIHFGAAPVYSQVLDAWLIAEGRFLNIAEDRAGLRRWQTEAESARVMAESARVEAESARVEAESARIEAERERLQREDVERRLRELEKKLA